MHLGLVVLKFDYATYLLLLSMVTYNSGLQCQSDSTNRKLKVVVRPTIKLAES